jgi:hypothetical protein
MIVRNTMSIGGAVGIIRDSEPEMMDDSMSTLIVSVGYTCPICGRRVTVLRSCDRIPEAIDGVQSECECGFGRMIRIDEIQSLRVWRETRR